MYNNIPLNQRLQKLPKFELHVHLEGFVDARFWSEMLDRNQVVERPSLEELEERFNFTDFAGFIACFRDLVHDFQNPRDFYHLTKKALAQQAAQGVIYTETYFTPIFYIDRGMNFHEIMQEVSLAAKEALRDWGIEMKILFDGVRNFGPPSVRRIFELATLDETGLVTGVGIGGDEKNFPAHQFIDEFAYARSQGLNLVCHAGETDGEASMLDAIELLGALRIGHALGIEEGSRIEEVIQKYDVSLELCPTSNLQTGQIKRLEDHPFGLYLKRGYQISLNSDDPGFFQSSILGEYEAMGRIHHLGPAEYCQLSLRALDSAFLPRVARDRWAKQVLQYFESWSQALG